MRAARIQLLVVDEDREAHPLYRLLLGHHRLVMTATYGEAWSELQRLSPDVVVCESSLWTDAADSFRRELIENRGRVCIVHSLEPARSDHDPVDLWLVKPAWDRLRDFVDRFAHSKAGIRREQRQQVRLRAFAWCSDWEAPLRVTTIDVSAQGAALDADEPAQAGSSVRLAIAGPGPGRVRIEGSVRYARPLPQSSRFRIGLKLTLADLSGPWFQPLLGDPSETEPSTGP